VLKTWSYPLKVKIKDTALTKIIPKSTS